MKKRFFSKVLAAVFAAAEAAAVGLAQETGGGPATALLRGTVLEADTGLSAACTVTIVDAAKRTVVENESFKGGFRSDGRFAKQLPAGRTRIRISRGLETVAQERDIVLPPGGETNLTFLLQRRVNLRQRGWYAGDSHTHMIHGEKTIPVDFDYVALAAQAEDLHYLSLGAAWQMEQPTPESLEAELAKRSKTNCVLTWNLEAPKNYYRGDAGRCLGHCWTLGLKGRTAAGQDIIPLLQQASAHDYESTKPSFANFESQQLIRAQGGAVFYTHPARWWLGAWGGQGGYPKQEKMRVSNMAVELPLDTLIGPTFDGLDILTGAGEFQANALAFELWVLLLNQGYRVAATASSDCCFDRPGGATPGASRTYTYLAGGFSWPAVARATAQGRTFTTTGPLLLATLDGQPPGSIGAAGVAARTLAIEGWAAGTDARGLTRLEILRNGAVSQASDYQPPVFELKTNFVLRETQTAWYCVRLFGGDPRRQTAVSGAFFFHDPMFQPPAPVPARVQVSLVDAVTAQGLAGTVTEVAYHGPLRQEGPSHVVEAQGGRLTVPGTVRLRAQAPGYQPLTLSPFLDHPALVQAVTGLQAADLARWETFEQVRKLLGETRLVFRLSK